MDGRFDTIDDGGELVEAVLAHYRAALAEAPAVHGWLVEHGISNGEAVERFGLGWSDRTLGRTFPSGTAGRRLREELQAAGWLRETGHEQFRGCLVVPVRDEAGRVVQCYGRRVQRPQRRDGREAVEVLWLPAPTTAVWHVEALSCAEVIVAGDVLDALVWFSTGYRHVIAPGGPDGLPADIGELLVGAGVTRVLLAQPRTPDGEQAAAALAGQLASVGMQRFRVVFPHGCDAASVAVDATDATAALGERLRAAQWIGDGPAPSRTPTPVSDESTPPAPARHVRAVRPLPPATGPRPEPDDTDEARSSSTPSPIPPPPPAGRDVEVDGGELRMTIGALSWRVRGLDRVTGPGSLRVTVSARHVDDGAFHLDVVDLFSARARQQFLTAAAVELGVRDQERLRRDLGRVLLACEDRVLDLQHQAQQPQEPAPAMHALEEEQALELLRDPNLIERIVGDIAALGVVGEADNALLAYLAATSRLLDSPLAVVVQSGSAAGKSTLTDAVLSLMPTESRLSVSAMTGQSLFYLGETELAHKILSVAEVEGAQRAAYPLKVLQSDGELSIASTGKDTITGELVTKTYRVQGPVALFLTTTAPTLDEELANRCVVLGVDEDQAQTRAILAAQRHAQTITGLLAKHERDQLRGLHANAQRLLEPVAVVNPLAPSLTFADGRTRARRDQAKLLTLIRAVTLLHQHQRPRRRVTRHGVEVVFIETTPADVAVAERLAPLIVAGPNLADLAPQTRRLLDLLDVLVTGEAQQDRCRREDIRFTRRDVREHTGWSDVTLRKHLGRLVELELVRAHRAYTGAYHYELLWQPDSDCGDADPTVEIDEYDSTLAPPSRPVRAPFARALTVVPREP